MRTDLILTLYFFLIAVIALLLKPTCLVAVFELEFFFAIDFLETES